MYLCFKLHFRAPAFVLVAVLCGCASVVGSANHSGMPGGLPQLPAGLFDRHRPAQVEILHLEGTERFLESPSAAEVGSSLQLTADSGQPALEWAIWQLAVTAGSIPQTATINLNINSGTSAWVGIANYSTNSWQLEGPYISSGAKVIAPLSTGNVSLGGYVYVMAAAYSGTQITVGGVDIEVDVPAPPTYFITGTLKDTRVNMGFKGQTVTLSPGNIQATTNNKGIFTFVDLDPGNYSVWAPEITGYDLDPVSIPVDLTSGNMTNADFLYTPQESAITYTNTIKLLFDSTCVECHNAGTPGRVRLDVYISPDSNDVFHNAEVALERVANNSMPSPPYDPWVITQKQALQDWIQVYNKAE